MPRIAMIMYTQNTTKKLLFSHCQKVSHHFVFFPFSKLVELQTVQLLSIVYQGTVRFSGWEITMFGCWEGWKRFWLIAGLPKTSRSLCRNPFLSGLVEARDSFQLRTVDHCRIRSGRVEFPSWLKWDDHWIKHKTALLRETSWYPAGGGLCFVCM